MFALGLPDEVIKQVKELKSLTEIEQKGNDFKITVTTGPKVMVNTFTIGKETEMDTITGEKIKVRAEPKLCCYGKVRVQPPVRHLFRLQVTLTLAPCFKTVFHLDGNKLKVSLKGIESVTELADPNTIVSVSGSAAADRSSNRC